MVRKTLRGVRDPVRPIDKDPPKETDDTVESAIRLPKELQEDILKICSTRNISFIDYTRIALRGAVKTNRVYGPDDELKFGRFYGEQLQHVMKADPSYIVWCRDNIASFGLTKEAEEMLESLLMAGQEADENPDRMP